LSLPFFYSENIAEADQHIVLDEETSRHIVQVLRMQEGEQLRLTDGKGHAAIAELIGPHKKHSTVQIISSSFHPRNEPLFTIGISLIKNAARFEWFLEKASELGVAEVVPLLCERTEKQHSKHERFVSICRSAMLQSEHIWMTVIREAAKLKEVIEKSSHNQKLIAHCAPGDKPSLTAVLDYSLPSQIILIGPEGDFSVDEIRRAEESGFEPVSLGNSRLRTETAGIVAAVVHSMKGF
jgi:16S rRNA (uracil1498-N3)-methyltransferase